MRMVQDGSVVGNTEWGLINSEATVVDRNLSRHRCGALHVLANAGRFLAKDPVTLSSGMRVSKHRVHFLKAFQTLPPEGAVIFCNEASGDEEVPQLVRGVVVSRDLPVLSHLALRARQLGVVFACTAESQLFEKLRKNVQETKAVKLMVDASGDVRAQVVADSELKVTSGQSSQSSAKPKLGELNLTGKKVLETVSIADQPQIAGSKAASSGKLEKLAQQLGFKAPKGLAIPFGVMKSAVQGSDFQSALKGLEAALSRNADVEAAAQADKLSVPNSILSEIQAGAERVAVRSSANSEDLEKVSGAGLHDSVLGVDIKDQSKLQQAILQVWGRLAPMLADINVQTTGYSRSMFTLRAVQSRYAAKMPLYDGIAMGVLIQPMVSLSGHAYAFIAFSKDAVAKNDKAVYIEMCIGLGETLASANEPGTPYRLVVQKDPPHEVQIASLGSFSNGLEDLPSGLQHERLSTDKDYLLQIARDVAKVAVGIEKGTAMELQWTWKALSWNVEVVEKSIWYRLGPLWAEAADPTLSAVAKSSCDRLLIGLSALGAL
eukprot:s5700_g2.t1